MTTHNLPAINDKTVKSVITRNGNGHTEEVRITFRDGSALVFTGVIKVRWEPAPTIVTAQSKWPGE